MNTKKIAFYLIAIAFFFVIGYASLLIFITWPISEFSINKAGAFGDSFGILTSLFSALAFTGMIITILMQKDELSLQRLELSLTRKELAASRKEHEKSAVAQNELVKQQVISAKISGLSSIVQGRYQYASAHGSEAHLYLTDVESVEKILLKSMEEAGLGKIKLPRIN